MVFRIVDKSSFAFRTDLPPSSRSVHPSGMLHAFRATSLGSNRPRREEHAFAWIADCLHVDVALDRMRERGFDVERGVVFLPYSTKKNWIERYPHAAPAMECDGEGKLTVYLNYRPYPNGLGSLEGPGGGERTRMRPEEEATTTTAAAMRKRVEEELDEDEDEDGVPTSASSTRRGQVRIVDAAGNCSERRSFKDEDDDGDDKPKKKRKHEHVGRTPHRRRKHKSRAPNVVRDRSCLPDAARDELHVEIYAYLRWLSKKLAAVEASAIELAAATAGARAEEDDDGGDRRAEVAARAAEEARTEWRQRLKEVKGVDVDELREVLGGLEATFAILPNAKLELEGGDEGRTGAAMVPAEAAGAGAGGAGEDEKKGEDGGGADRDDETSEREASEAKDPESEDPNQLPFLEEALGDALERLVESREVAGKKRRSRRRTRKRSGNPNRDHDRRGTDFDDMFDRLSRYKAEHGDCRVTKSKADDPKLFHWVQNLRSHRAALLKKGIEREEAPHAGRRVSNKTLTVERVARLEGLGFQWSVQGPKTSWEDRFRDCAEYVEANGRWPSQSMGKLGEWVHKQRTMYAKNDKAYMKAKAPLLDSVGFEWTPRGNTRLSWDEGFEMLMAFGNEHGHFNVPCPPPEFDGEGKPLDSRKSDARRLYNWVESLHGMYRSYKLGRRSGSLTDERVVFLIKHGFVFRND